MTRSRPITTAAIHALPITGLAALCAAGALALCTSSGAQEGFPLDGTWRGAFGDAGGDPGSKTTVVIVMQWDGKTIGGRVNPGSPNSGTFSAAALNPSDWTVRFEAALPRLTLTGNLKPETGALPADALTVPVVIEGKLGDLGSYHRTITGTWTQAGVVHELTLRRE